MKKVFILLLIPVAMFMGCSKSNEGSEPVISDDCEVSKIIDGGETMTLEYDEKGRVTLCQVRWNDTDDGVTHLITLTYKLNYLNDRIEVKAYDYKNILYDDYEFRIDASGKITKAIGKVSPISEVNYSYSAEGYLIKEVYKEKEHGGEFESTQVFNYENGNLTSKTSKEKRGGNPQNPELKSQFHYDTNEENFPYSSLDARIFDGGLAEDYIHILYEHGYFGEKSKDRIIKAESRSYTYEKNNRGEVRLIKVTDEDSGGRSDGYITIEYKCDK